MHSRSARERSNLRIEGDGDIGIYVGPGLGRMYGWGIVVVEQSGNGPALRRPNGYGFGELNSQ